MSRFGGELRGERYGGGDGEMVEALSLEIIQCRTRTENRTVVVAHVSRRVWVEEKEVIIQRRDDVKLTVEVAAHQTDPSRLAI